MASFDRIPGDSDEEVDVEALRLAALKSIGAKPKFKPRVNHRNLISIVPVNIVPPLEVKPAIKLEPISPTREENIIVQPKTDEAGNNTSKESQDGSSEDEEDGEEEEEEDIVDKAESEDGKVEEDSFDKLLEEFEAEISGSKPLPTKSPKKTEKRKKKKKKKKRREGEAEVELVEVKLGKRHDGSVINIRESATPEPVHEPVNEPVHEPVNEPVRCSEEPWRQRSRTPVRSRSRSYRRSRSRSWYRSPRRSRSPYRPRSRSPLRARSRTRSPYRRAASPGRWSPPPYRRYSRSRSRSYIRRSKSPRRAPAPLSPRRRSPFGGSLSPRRRRSLSPRRRFSKSPLRRRSRSPILRSSKSPIGRLRSPMRRRSKSPRRRSPARPSVSPLRRPLRRSKSPRRSLSLSVSPSRRRNRSPLRVVEKNKQDESIYKRKPRSLSKERVNKPRARPSRRFSPARRRRSPDRTRRKSLSPKRKQSKDPIKPVVAEGKPEDKATVPLDPVLEARKKKFETLCVVDPNVDKKISLKSVKETIETTEDKDDDDAVSLGLDEDPWEDEEEESDNERESRFKLAETKTNRTVLSFRNLRGDTSKRAVIKLSSESRDRRGERKERWPQRDRRDNRRGRRHKERPERTDRNAESTRSDRTVLLPRAPNQMDNEVSTTVASDRERLNDRRAVGTSAKAEGEGEADDFDTLMSEFEKELNSDICLAEPESPEKPRISVKKDLFQSTSGHTQKQADHSVPPSTKFEPQTRGAKPSSRVADVQPGTEDMPDDYNDDDDFVLESRARIHEEVDSSSPVRDTSDLRAVLSRRRTERLNKAPPIMEMPSRLVQSAFLGIGNNKISLSESAVSPKKKVKTRPAAEETKRRRVLLLDEEPTFKPVTSIKVTIPEVDTDSTMRQLLHRSEDRKRSRKVLRKELDPDDEDVRLPRRFKLKRNVTLTSQV